MAPRINKKQTDKQTTTTKPLCFLQGFKGSVLFGFLMPSQLYFPLCPTTYSTIQPDWISLLKNKSPPSCGTCCLLLTFPYHLRYFLYLVCPNNSHSIFGFPLRLEFLQEASLLDLVRVTCPSCVLQAPCSTPIGKLMIYICLRWLKFTLRR